MVISAGVDLIDIAIRGLFQIITVFRVIAEAIGTVLETVIGVILRAVLTPVIEPFAWLVGFIIDLGIGWVSNFINLKNTISDIAEWVIKQSKSFITSFANAINQLR